VLLDYLLNNWLEFIGVVSGLVCVWLLVKENILTFPVGLIYALITVVVVARANLFADVLLNLYYVLMNAYGWYYWLYGGSQQRQHGLLKPVKTTARTNLILFALTIAGSILMGWVFAEFSAADLAYADSFTTVASFTAMWMTARKHLYSWIAWFVIDVVQIALYLLKGFNGESGLFLYAGLYTVYLAMAVIGFRSWQKSMLEES
jgi:nicotinamide mononucleotide transporter|tara:strand:+ start:973 stop:1584 length:612 start_codon:yes stop_codon:yes gene_type:complete